MYINECDLAVCLQGLRSPSAGVRTIAYRACETIDAGVSRGAPLASFLRREYASPLDRSFPPLERSAVHLCAIGDLLLGIWFELFGRHSGGVQYLFWDLALFFWRPCLDVMVLSCTSVRGIFLRCPALHVAACSVLACGVPCQAQYILLGWSYFCVLAGIHLSPLYCRLVSVATVGLV